MKIELDSSAICGFIQNELESRWNDILENSEKLPFSNTMVIKTSDVGRLIYRDFTNNIAKKIQESQNFS